MKIRLFAVVGVLIGLSISPVTSTSAVANLKPVVEEFKFTPDEVELSDNLSSVSFELTVSHPLGIKNVKVPVYLTKSKSFSLMTELFRTDSPIEQKKNRVTFKGSIEIPRDVPSGLYEITAGELLSGTSGSLQYSTGIISSPKLRDISGAESGLLIREYGYLNLPYETFVGPSYKSNFDVTFLNSANYNRSRQQIWKVGEIFDPQSFFELRAKGIELQTSSSTEAVCKAEKGKLSFIAIGTCKFSIYTNKTKEYLEFKYSESVEITAARPKMTLTVDSIPTQTTVGLPKTVDLPMVYSVTSGFIVAKSQTPSICIASLMVVRLISGGTCILSYQSPETNEYRASDVYLQTFEIVRTPQTLEFAPSLTLDLKSKTLTLSASASSGAAVAFNAEPAANCNVTGTTLNLLKAGNCVVTAQQAGTTTIAPISKTVTISITGKAARELRMISCVKGAQKVSVTKVKPKCPKGYSRVR